MCRVVCVGWCVKSHTEGTICPTDSPLLLLSSTSMISFRRWLGVLFMAERMERRMTDSASFTKMNTMLTCGRFEGYVMFLHLHTEREREQM